LNIKIHDLDAMDAGFRRFLQDDVNLSELEIENLSVHQLLASRQCYEDKLEEQLNGSTACFSSLTRH
jgi:hypothetical protein